MLSVRNNHGHNVEEPLTEYLKAFFLKKILHLVRNSVVEEPNITTTCRILQKALAIKINSTGITAIQLF